MIPVRSYLNLLSKYLRPQRGRVALLTLTILAGIAIQLANPQLIRVFLDRVTGGDRNGLTALAVWFIVLAFFQQGLSVLATWQAEYVGWTATNRMRTELTEHVLGLDMGFHKKRTPGELIERIDGDVTALTNFFSAFVIKVGGNVTLLLGVLVLLWVENAWIGFGLTVFSVAAMAVMIGLQQVAVPWWKAVRGTSAELYGFIGEQVEGTEDIRGNGGVPYMIHKFTLILRRWLPQHVKGRHGFSLMWGTNIGVYVVSTGIVFWLGSIFFGRCTMTIGSVYLVFHYLALLRHPMDEIRNQMEDFQKAGAGIERVGELFAETSGLDTSGSALTPRGALRVELDDMTFAYDDAHGGEIVLADLTLDIEPGRIVGVLGRSGSGKTTLARSRTRLYDPVRGEIRIGGIDVRGMEVHDLRHSVGMITQDVQLFRATVRDNLTFFDDTVDDDDLFTRVEALGLGGWLRSLPNGLDTMLEAGGAGLSAGQAQLLAFCRIYLADPGLVILDEASSRVDPATEQLIERAVDGLLSDRTGLIIAHRLATVQRADDILILEDGHVVEYGDRTVLMADEDSRLSHLLAAGMEEVLA
jgi:ATP-binding cassette subfamily B protein